jgi:hypothetical protein
MIFHFIAALAGIASLVIMVIAPTVVDITRDRIEALSWCTAGVGLMALSLWLDGEPAGAVGVLVTILLAGVLAITWCVRQERVVVPDDVSSLEDKPWLNE